MRWKTKSIIQRTYWLATGDRMTLTIILIQRFLSRHAIYGMFEAVGKVRTTNHHLKNVEFVRSLNRVIAQRLNSQKVHFWFSHVEYCLFVIWIWLSVSLTSQDKHTETRCFFFLIPYFVDPNFSTSHSLMGVWMLVSQCVFNLEKLISHVRNQSSFSTDRGAVCMVR